MKQQQQVLVGIKKSKLKPKNQLAQEYIKHCLSFLNCIVDTCHYANELNKNKRTKIDEIEFFFYVKGI